MIDSDASNAIIAKLNSRLNEFENNLRDVDVESEIATAKSAGTEALRILLHKYGSQHVQLRGIKTKCIECVSKWECQIDYAKLHPNGPMPNAPADGPSFIIKFKELCDIAGRLQDKADEIGWKVAPAFYKNIVEQSRTAEEIQSLISACQLRFDNASSIPVCSRSDSDKVSFRKATIMLSLYKEALASLSEDPGGHSERLINDLDVELADLAEELPTLDLDSDPVVTRELDEYNIKAHLLANDSLQKRAFICQERCRSSMLWWQDLGKENIELPASHFIAEFGKRHEKASYFLRKYNEILWYFRVAYGKCTVAKISSREKLEKALQRHQRQLESYNEIDIAGESYRDRVYSQTRKDYHLMMIELYREALTRIT